VTQYKIKNKMDDFAVGLLALVNPMSLFGFFCLPHTICIRARDKVVILLTYDNIFCLSMLGFCEAKLIRDGKDTYRQKVN
jgi:hypothetical protein